MTNAWNSPLTLACLLLAGLAVADGSANPLADVRPVATESTLEKGRRLYDAGKWQQAEPLLGSVLAAIEAGQLSRQNLGRCLQPLTNIYRREGKHAEARRTAQLYRDYIRNLANLDPASRNTMLMECAAELAEINWDLRHPEEAYECLAEAIQINRKTSQSRPADMLFREVGWARTLAQRDTDRGRVEAFWADVAKHAAGVVERLGKQIAGGGRAAHYSACVDALTQAYDAVGNYQQAIDINLRLLSIQQKRGTLGEAAATAARIAALEVKANDFDQAGQYVQRALKTLSSAQAPLTSQAAILAQLADTHKQMGQLTEATDLWNQSAQKFALALSREKLQARKTPLLEHLSLAYQELGRYEDAIQQDLQLLDLTGKDNPFGALLQSKLAALYGLIGDYDSARRLLVEARDYWNRRTPAEPLQVASVLHDLAVIERAAGSFEEAERLFGEAIRIRREYLPGDDLQLGHALANLASVRSARGHYAEAIRLYQEAIAVYRAHGPIARDWLSTALMNMAMTYKSQGRLAEALQYCQKAIEAQQIVGPSGRRVSIERYCALAALALALDQLDQADTAIQAALAEHKTQPLPDNALASLLHLQGLVAYLRDDLPTARKHWQDALRLQRAAGQAASQARSLTYLAQVAALEGDAAQAIALYGQALELAELVQANPVIQHKAHCGLAEVLFDCGRTDEAIEHLERGVQLLELPRSETVGAELERAEVFSQFAPAFDRLVQWNLERGDVDAALRYAERSRNRTFLDQLRLGGIDLRETLTGQAQTTLLPREKALRNRMQSLRDQIQRAASSGTENARLRRLHEQLTAVRSEYFAVRSEIRNASPLYRERVAEGVEVSLERIQQHLGQSGGMMLFYYLGFDRSFVLLVGDSAQPVQTFPLQVSPPLAQTLGLPGGPLTRPVAVKLVSQFVRETRDQSRGLTGNVVRSPKGAPRQNLEQQLTEAILPRDVRIAIEQSTRPVKCITVVPDGALHHLPLEALVTATLPKPRYVLDSLPPIHYVPSASVWLNLLDRPDSTAKTVKVLTVGNPDYAAASSPDEAADEAIASAAGPQGVETLSRAAFGALGGTLQQLPGTMAECERVARAFSQYQVTFLHDRDATQAGVSARIEGCRFVHLAAHGLAEHQHDNCFGAIALAAPRTHARSDEDDGFLELREIQILPLEGCDLAALSACQTNVGPDRPLEAGTSLAQAFLIAGAKRVICSHWNVDDASTAELIGSFFEDVAQSLRAPGSVDYAVALHEAKKRLRHSSRWSDPYYWAPFVLVGPQ